MNDAHRADANRLQNKNKMSRPGILCCTVSPRKRPSVHHTPKTLFCVQLMRPPLAGRSVGQLFGRPVGRSFVGFAWFAFEVLGLVVSPVSPCGIFPCCLLLPHCLIFSSLPAFSTDADCRFFLLHSFLPGWASCSSNHQLRSLRVLPYCGHDIILCVCV